MISKWIIMQTLKKMLSSRKFIYTIIGCIVQILSDSWGIDPSVSQPILISICTLVLGQGIADINKK
jgi:hypothetical protein